MATGYAHREVTQPPDWHGLVVWDFLFNAGTTGLFLVAAVADLARPAVFGSAATWAYPIALGLLLVDLVFLVLDLGHPARFHHMLRVVKPSSPMSLGTWCLTAYSLPLAVAAAASLFGWDEVRRIAAAVGILPALGAVGYKGVLFSTSSQPGWRDARWLGGYHTATAVVIGVAGLMVLSPADSANHLRPAGMATAVLAMVVEAVLLSELAPALASRYPRWVSRPLRMPFLSGWWPVCLLLGSSWAGVHVAGLVLAVAWAWLVRRVVVLLPQRPHG